MKVKTVEYENFNNYQEPVMFIGTCKCSWKCCIEAGIDCSVCQNHEWSNNPDIEIEDDKLIKSYINNPLTNAIVFGGLEPFDQFEEIITFIEKFRKVSDDIIIIYTGYYENEVGNQLERLKQFKNIIVKFGRFVPDLQSIYNVILGVTLASCNQYAIKIS